MIKKSYSTTGKKCRTTFKMPSKVNATSAHLVGEFNDWDEEAHPMKKLKDGSFSVTVTLVAGKSYRYRYLLDEKRWENDWSADGYVANEFGGEDSIVEV